MIRTWCDPQPWEVKPGIEDFLQQLGGPVAIHLTGEDSSRSRVLVTLSHGNEPSGLKAVHRWLRRGATPAVSVVVLICGVRAALLEPLFSFRQPPGERDLNRCFGSPEGDRQGQLASEMLQHIRQLRPEALVDLHNTSGSSPAFAIAVGGSREQRSLVSLFVRHLIVTELQLGSLMEQALGCPQVTIEVGGAVDESSRRVADEGIHRYFTARDVLNVQTRLEISRHPMRLELRRPAQVRFAEHPLPDCELTVRVDIEKFNTTPLGAVDRIGWLQADALDRLRVTSNAAHPHRVEDFFRVEGGQLYPRQAMRLFMATTRPDVASSDCLFYFVLNDR